MPRRVMKPECPDEYEVMRLPRSFWGMSQEGMTATMQRELEALIDNADLYCRRGFVLVLYGPAHTGKSGAAAVIAKKTMETGLRGLWTNPSTIRDAVRWDFDYSHDKSYLFYVKQVSLLVIDDLVDTDYTEKLYGLKDYRDLVLRRAEAGRSTIITTRMPPEAWRWVYDDCARYFTSVSCREAHRVVAPSISEILSAPLPLGFEAPTPLVAEQTLSPLQQTPPALQQLVEAFSDDYNDQTGDDE